MQCRTTADSTGEGHGSWQNCPPFRLRHQLHCRRSQATYTSDQLATNSGFPTTLSSLLITRRAHKIQESPILLITILLKRTIKGINQPNEETHKARVPSTELPCPLRVDLGHVILWALWCVHQPGSSPELWVPQIFIGVSLFRHDWLNHWSHEWIQPPAPFLPGDQVYNTWIKALTLKSHASYLHHDPTLPWVISLSKSQVLSRGPPWRKKALLPLGKLQEFLIPLSGTQDKDQIPYYGKTDISDWP